MNDISVCVQTVLADKQGEQEIICLQRDGTTNSLEIVKLVAKKDMYTVGLEKNHVKLVDMCVMSHSLRKLIQAHIDIDNFNERTWNEIYNAYAKFIDRRLKFDKITEFINKPIDSREEWV
jgi:hypothetical protein